MPLLVVAGGGYDSQVQPFMKLNLEKCVTFNALTLTLPNSFNPGVNVSHLNMEGERAPPATSRRPPPPPRAQILCDTLGRRA